MEQQSWQDRAERMARRQEDYLLNPAIEHRPAEAMPLAVNLARDYLHHLHQPERTVSFVLAFHRTATCWAAWASWATALDLALEASATVGAPPDCIMLLNARSQVARELNRYVDARLFGQQALALAERHGDCGLLAMTHNKLGMIALRQDDLSTAITEFSQAYQIGAGHVSELELGHFTINLGTAAVSQQDYPTAERAFAQALAHYTAADDEVAVARVQCNIVDLQQRMGALQAMPPALLAARARFKEHNVLQDYGLAENDIGYIHYRLGELDAAQDAYHRALAIFEQIGGLATKAQVLSNLVALYIDRRDWPSAERAIEQGSQLAELCDKQQVLANIRYDQGRMFVAQDRLDDARRAWQAARAGYRACGVVAEAERMQALLESLDGDGRLAREAT